MKQWQIFNEYGIMIDMIKIFIKFLNGIDLTKKQLEKIADQLRLLSWAQGAILSSSTGFHLKLNFGVAIIIGLLWVFLQIMSIILDKRSEDK